jgi:hypothetical protein
MFVLCLLGLPSRGLTIAGTSTNPTSYQVFSQSFLERGISMRLFMLSLVGAALLACGCGQTGPKTFNDVVISPKYSATPGRIKAKADLAIILGERIRNNTTISRSGGKVIINITNFRNAIESDLQKAFESNFQKVTPKAKEEKQGLELVLMDAKSSELNDTMDFSVVLTDGGKDVIEYRDTVKPPTKVVSTTIYTWQDDLKNLTVEYVEWDIDEMIKMIYGKIMINDNLSQFWSKYR